MTDVFLSYAHVDNETFGGESNGFVSRFAADLTGNLRQKIGGRAVSVWWDTWNLRGNSPVTPDITDAASGSTCLVLVLSPSYLLSEWCARERNSFLRHVGERQAAHNGTLFVIELDKFERDQLPVELRDLRGYPFWRSLQDRTIRALRPDFESDKENYWDRLSAVVQDIADALKRTAGNGKISGSAGNGQIPAPAASGEDAAAVQFAPVVLLSEVTDDLVSEREQLSCYLRQLGIKVLPEKRYSRDDQDQHRQQMSSDLAAAKLFVQLLSDVPGDKSDTPRGWPWLRYQLAKDAGRPVLQWRASELEAEKAADADQRELLGLDTVRACGLEEFKKAVADEARKPPPRTKPSSSVTKSVFVNAEQADLPFAENICGWLVDKGYAVLKPLCAGEPADVRSQWETNLELCDRLMLVYGAAPSSWVTKQTLHSVKVLSQRSEPPEMLAICLAPPAPKNELPLMFHNLRYIRCEEGLNAARLAEHF